MTRTALLLLAGLGACGGSQPPQAPVEPPATTSRQTPPAPRTRESRGAEQDLADTLAFFAMRPREETVLDPGLEPVQGIGAKSAATCGACHQAIYEEWALSTHRHAWNDPQFQKEMGKSGNTWLCRNCHTPTLAQQPVWPVGLVEGDVEAPILVANARHDAALMDEGVTCVGCHVRDGVIHGPGLQDSTAPHPVAADPDYRSGALCLRCHQAVRTYPGKGFVCTFTTGQEWAESPQGRDGQACVACHMPEITRPVATGGPERTVRRHWFKGAGIPKFADAAPPADAAPGPGLELEAHLDGRDVVLDVRNAHAGHHLPSGDPERWVQVDVVFEGGDGSPVGTPWQHRLGQIWEWYPKPRRVSDNRLVAGEARTLRVPVPDGAVTARIRASNHRMSEENARYHDLLPQYPLSVNTHSLEISLVPTDGGG